MATEKTEPKKAETKESGLFNDQERRTLGLPPAEKKAVSADERKAKEKEKLKKQIQDEPEEDDEVKEPEEEEDDETEEGDDAAEGAEGEEGEEDAGEEGEGEGSEEGEEGEEGKDGKGKKESGEGKGDKETKEEKSINIDEEIKAIDARQKEMAVEYAGWKEDLKKDPNNPRIQAAIKKIKDEFAAGESNIAYFNQLREEAKALSDVISELPKEKAKEITPYISKAIAKFGSKLQGVSPADKAFKILEFAEKLQAMKGSNPEAPPEKREKVKDMIIGGGNNAGGGTNNKNNLFKRAKNGDQDAIDNIILGLGTKKKSP
jgi:hypothetical protein